MVQWPFLVLEGTVSRVSGGFHSGSSRGVAWLVAGGGLLSMELGTRFGLLEQLRVLAHLATGPECISPCWLSFQGGLDCLRWINGLKETALQAFYYSERVHQFWSQVRECIARIDPKQLVLLDIGYIMDNIDPPYRVEKRVVFLAILATARMVIWEVWKKGLYNGANFSHPDLILFLGSKLDAIENAWTT